MTTRGWTVREIVVTFDRLPEVPVMVTVSVPVVADPLDVSVNVLVLVVVPDPVRQREVRPGLVTPLRREIEVHVRAEHFFIPAPIVRVSMEFTV